ncbi:MAG: DNA replication/repair protein RecF [Lachnospiraceae bacterium]|nr:DNA replication/repair protein RecF [Lachnospiraceae bacterium]
MIVKQIELHNFRNYENLQLNFSDQVNIFYGDNAQGKTNILESVYVCSTTKSHKGTRDRDMIKLGEEEGHIRMHLEKKGIPHRIDMHLKKNKTKGVAIDGIPIRRSAELFGMMNVIFFSPEDLSMIKNGPGERRRFMDLELCQLNKLYLYYLSNYNKILDQRNNLLKQISFNSSLQETLEVWDQQLCEYGTKIIESRAEFVKEMNELVGDTHSTLSGGRERLQISYEPSVASGDMAEKLKKTREQDIYRKATGYGPHRDDISFFVGDVNLKQFGSQGQQRTAALSLKLAEIELVKKKIGENPVLLLDDVLSELDRKRQHHLLNSMEGIQTMLTCTGLEEFVGDRQKFNHIFHVMDGMVSEQEENPIL